MGREERKLQKQLTRHETRKERAQRAKRKASAEARSSGFATQAEVVGTGPGVCRVRTEEGESLVRAIRGVAPGDRVVIAHGGVRRILDRSTFLGRPDPGNPHELRVLAANIDVVVNVVSVASPPLRPGLIDRFLIAIARGGAEPLIVVNKIDLGGDTAALDPYRSIGVPVFCCSAQNGTGIAELAVALAGRLAVFTGHSGVGKSSLLNALCPGLQLRTAEVAEGKGRHTTTASNIYSLPNGGRIIDTPGIRELGLWDVDSATVRACFPEFASANCRFRDCLHVDEPGCAVRDSVAPQRYRSYLRLIGRSGE